ncbi:MAG: hypothetical protein AB8B93_06860, partial [Pseudomonadales bacterium]
MPHTQELTYQSDPTTLFARLLELPAPVLLHSADRHSRFGRFDVMAAAPRELVRYENGLLHIGAQTSATATPLAELSRSFNPLLASEQTPSSHFKWG